MQMGNRMDKNVEVRYYPIAENAPLSDYVTIGEETRFEVDGEGYLTILFPAGTVTEPAHGEHITQRQALAYEGNWTAFHQNVTHAIVVHLPRFSCPGQKSDEAKKRPAAREKRGQRVLSAEPASTG